MNKLNRKIIILSVLLLVPVFLVFSGEIFEAKIYREGTDRQEFLFDYRNEITTEGNRLIKAHNYYSPNGELFAREEVVYTDDEFFTHKTEFYAIEEFSRLEKNGRRLEISFRKENKEKSKELDFPDGLVFGPTQQEYIIENLSKFKSGEKLEFLLPVPEFTTTTAFTMVREEGTRYQQENRLVLRMETRNFLLRFLVGKNYFVIDDTSGLIIEIHGPSILQVYENGKWNLVDVDIYFNYKE